MKKKLLLPRGLEIFRRILVVCLVAAICLVLGVLIGALTTSCTQQVVARVDYKNLLEAKCEKYANQIYAYNSLLHRIWIDKPNYFEDVLCESDEWMALDRAVDGDFQHAFEFVDAEDSLSYRLNWDAGDENIRVVKHIIPPVTQKKLDAVFNGDSK